MSSMSQQKQGESQQQVEMPSTVQQAPEGEMGNQAAVEEAGIESQAQSPKARLDELMGDPEAEPFDVATAYAEMQDVHKIERMITDKEALKKATGADPVAWSMIEGSFQTAMSNRGDLLAQWVAADAGLQEGIAATVEAALADHNEGLEMMAVLNFQAGELKYEHESLQAPKNAERRVHIGPELERAFGAPDVAITIENANTPVEFSDLELGDVYSNQTVSGITDFEVQVEDRLGVLVRERVHAEAAEAVARQLPGDILIGMPTFE